MLDGKSSRPTPALLLLLFAACLLAAALPAVHRGVTVPLLRTLVPSAAVKAATEPPAPVMPTATGTVLPTAFGSVQRYSLPCQLPAAGGGNGSVPGVLHIYLKALRWPQPRSGGDGPCPAHHLRLRGFVAFEFINRPPGWRAPYLFHNPPEVGRTLRLMLRGSGSSAASGGGGGGGAWRRRVPLEFLLKECEYRVREPGFDYQECLVEERRKLYSSWPSPQSAFDLGHVSLDLGPDPPLDLEIGVDGWPRWLTLAPQLAAALAAPPGRPVGGGASASASAPPLYQAMPYLRTLAIDHVALLLARSWEYHVPLGVAGLLMYVQPHWAAALAAQPLVRELTASGRVALVLWEGFAGYDGWIDYDLQVVEAHATLSLWGEGVLVLVQDPDEYLVPTTVGATLPDLLRPGTGCLAQLRTECRFLARRDIFPPAAAASGAVDEPQLWRTPGRHPLLRYGSAKYRPQPKSLVDPAATLPVDVHVTSACVGADTVLTPGNDASPDGDLRSACAQRQACDWVHPGCAWLAHVQNMVTQRVDVAAANLTDIWPAGWLWPLLGGGAGDGS